MRSFDNERCAKRIISIDRREGLDQTAGKIILLLRTIRGSVLELGPGGGNLIRCFDPSVAYTALEPNRYLHDVLHRAIAARGISTSDIVALSAEEMTFPDETFDAVVSVRTLCSMHDLPRVLRNIKRVLKPGGVFYFAEHVGAPRWSWRWILQQISRPFWWYVARCNPAVDIATAIEQAGFSRVAYEGFRVGGRRNIVVRLRIAGSATK